MKLDYIIQTIVAAILVAMLVWMCSCNTPKPMVTTTSNTEVKHDSTTHTTTETEVKETIKESQTFWSFVQSVFARINAIFEYFAEVFKGIFNF